MFPMYIVILFCVYFYLTKISDIRYMYMSAVGIWGEEKYKYVIETITNIILNYVLGRFFGVSGIILATIISLFTINFLWITGTLYNNYFKNKSKKEFFKNHFIYAIITTTACITTYCCCNFILIEGIIGIMLKAILCCIIPNLIYVFFYRKNKYFKETILFIKSNLRINCNKKTMQ